VPAESRVALLTQGRRLPELDGVRGIAILLILVRHSVVWPAGQMLQNRAPRLYALLDASWCGVDLFFVLSGFLIAGILLDHRDAPNLLRVFYTRRACRILPAYLLLLLVASLPIGGAPQIAEGELPLAVYLAFLQNLWSAAGARVAFALGPCWSLAIEEQFYLGLPVLLLWVFRRHFGSFAAAMLLVPPLLRCLCLATGWQSPWDFTPCRLDAPFWGVLAAVLVRDARAGALMLKHRRVLGWVASAGLLGIAAMSQLALVSGGANLVLAFGLSLIAVTFTAALVSVLLSPESAGARLVRSAPLRWAGKHSYFLYLFHLIVVRLTPIPQLPLRLAVSTCALAVLAAISRRWLELPFLNLGAAVEYGAPAQRAQLQPYP
jgi:peptidoglycan/LPS O-acetylase OafA/YrhL